MLTFGIRWKAAHPFPAQVINCSLVKEILAKYHVKKPITSSSIETTEDSHLRRIYHLKNDNKQGT